MAVHTGAACYHGAATADPPETLRFFDVRRQHCCNNAIQSCFGAELWFWREQTFAADFSLSLSSLTLFASPSAVRSFIRCARRITCAMGKAAKVKQIKDEECALHRAVVCGEETALFPASPLSLSLASGRRMHAGVAPELAPLVLSV